MIKIEFLYKKGDFKIHVHLTDTQTGQRVGCYDLQLTITADCSGFFCGFLLGH